MTTIRYLSEYVPRKSRPAADSLRLRTGIADPGTPLYRRCVEQVKSKYREHYGALVDPRPDLFVYAYDPARPPLRTDGVLGLAGLTSADGRRLLSESYLDSPVEQACAVVAPGERPDRARIAEMGPVASFYPGTGMFLMREIPWIAHHLGYDYLLSTLTEKLHNLAKAAGWDFHTLANARRADLTGNTTEWGSYYSTKPRTGILRCGQTVILRAAG